MRKTGETLISWGITPNLLGYKYIIDAMDIIRDDSEVMSSLHKRIYLPLAKKYGVRDVAIERSIRTAIGKLKSSQYQTELPKPIQTLIDMNLFCNSTFLATLAELEGGAESETD